MRKRKAVPPYVRKGNDTSHENGLRLISFATKKYDNKQHDIPAQENL